MPESYPLQTVYCTDEDLIVVAPGDFGALIPPSQIMAAGVDGAISAGGWTLSTAANLESRGVAAYGVVKLWGARGTPAATRFGPESPGQWMAIESVASTVATLRRLGLAPGVGEPPGTSAGLTGVCYQIATLRPQIERASRDLNARFGIDSSVSGRAPSDLYDLDDLRRACELTVLHTLYLASSRSVKEDDWKRKAAENKAQLAEVLGRLALRWGENREDQNPTTRVGRMSR